jgi:uncharacterized flavoprotein (TIGR03862 family)
MTEATPTHSTGKAAKIAVVGTGPAGLMAAEVLAERGAHVTLYDSMRSPARKFLLAGCGGLNLTHSEEFETFLTRYGAASARLRRALEAFPPDALRAWCSALGEPTFVGTSGRVFPASFRATPLLRAWLKRLNDLGVRFEMRHRWQGWDAKGNPIFAPPEGFVQPQADALILALGGASWPRLGSDGGWTDILEKEGIGLAPLRPVNCGFCVPWSENFRSRFAGEPIKSAVFSHGALHQRGEAVVTETGIEGGAIYALSRSLRETILANGETSLHVALRPDLSTEEIEERLRKSAEGRKPTLSNLLRKALKLPPVAIGLLYESRLHAVTPLSALSHRELAELINAVPIHLDGMAPIARAISTAGGILFDEIDEDFMLRKKPGVFVAGEMLDWEAPTGGYLLQACFSTGVAAAKGALRWVESKR